MVQKSSGDYIFLFAGVLCIFCKTSSCFFLIDKQRDQLYPKRKSPQIKECRYVFLSLGEPEVWTGSSLSLYLSVLERQIHTIHLAPCSSCHLYGHNIWLSHNVCFWLCLFCAPLLYLSMFVMTLGSSGSSLRTIDITLDLSLITTRGEV